MEDGVVRGVVTGTPQGGVISPLLCNVYLHQLDRAWQARHQGRLVRYADDLVVMCATLRQAERALAELTAMLSGLGPIFPLRKRRSALRQDQKPRAGTPGAGDRQTPSPHPGIRLVGRCLPVIRPARPDRSPWNRRCPQTRSGLAGGSRMPAVKDVGEPCAGEPHARFEVAGAGNGAERPMVTG